MIEPTKRHQVIYQGDQPAFAVIPFEQYQSLVANGLLENHTDEHYVPHEVVAKLVEKDINPIAAWREHLKISQTELAQRMGIKQASVADIEKSKTPRKATREKAAAALGIHPEQLNF